MLVVSPLRNDWISSEYGRQMAILHPAIGKVELGVQRFVTRPPPLGAGGLPIQARL